jgi:hypothetical protein
MDDARQGLMPCKHDISHLVSCPHCTREKEDAERFRLVRLYCDHHGVRPPTSFIEALLDDQHDTTRNIPMPQPEEDQTTETIEDVVMGVRIVRRLAEYNVVIVQVYETGTGRGWIDFYRAQWHDLAHGRVCRPGDQPLVNSMDTHRWMFRAVAMAAMKHEREALRDLYASVH